MAAPSPLRQHRTPRIRQDKRAQLHSWKQNQAPSKKPSLARFLGSHSVRCTCNRRSEAWGRFEKEQNLGSSVTPDERSMRARMAAHVLHSRYDSRDLTAPARAAFASKFERKVIEEAAERGEVLEPVEIKRRAEHLRKAHYIKMGLASGKARRKRAA
jgi:hypothetical protein